MRCCLDLSNSLYPSDSLWFLPPRNQEPYHSRDNTMITKADDAFDPNEPALIVTFGNTGKKYRRLYRQVTILGRGRGCDIGLIAPDVSDVHCVISRTATGLHIRDCASRSGTRLNGAEVREAVLHDGAVLQIGPFSFRVFLPSRMKGPDGAPANPERLQRSRTRLVRRAWEFRHRLRELESRRQIGQRAGHLADPLADPESQAAALAEQVRTMDQRQMALEQAERDLACDRETLDQEFAALQARIHQSEQELAHREAEVEEAIRNRWEQFQQQLRTAQEQLHLAQAKDRSSTLDDSFQRREPPHTERDRFPRHLKPKRGGSGIHKIQG